MCSSQTILLSYHPTLHPPARPPSPTPLLLVLHPLPRAATVTLLAHTHGPGHAHLRPREALSALVAALSKDPSNSKFRADLDSTLSTIIDMGDVMRKKAGKMEDGGEEEKEKLYASAIGCYDSVLHVDENRDLAHYGTLLRSSSSPLLLSSSLSALRRPFLLSSSLSALRRPFLLPLRSASSVPPASPP